MKDNNEIRLDLSEEELEHIKAFAKLRRCSIQDLIIDCIEQCYMQEMNPITEAVFYETMLKSFTLAVQESPHFRRLETIYEALRKQEMFKAFWFAEFATFETTVEAMTRAFAELGYISSSYASMNIENIRKELLNSKAIDGHTNFADWDDAIKKSWDRMRRTRDTRQANKEKREQGEQRQEEQEEQERQEEYKEPRTFQTRIDTYNIDGK